MTNPADIADPIVEDVTYPAGWEFDDQRAYQVIVTDPDAPADWLYNSGKITSAVDTHTISRGIVRRDDKTYRQIVRAWDTVDREKTPGDPTYVEVTRDFTFNDDPTVDPATNLGAAAQEPSPWIDVVWQRGDSPDSWQIWRDNELLDKVDGPDLLLGGTTYRFRDHAARPRRDHVYKVRAVVNGQSSRNNPTVACRAAPVGVWLSDMDRDTNVMVIGGEAVEAKMVEVGENYEPIGSKRPIRVRSSKRGLEGTVDGQLGQVIGSNVTGQTWRERVLELKDEDENRQQLTWGDVSIPVRVYDISVEPFDTAGDTDLVYHVSFSFHQVGEPYDFKTSGTDSLPVGAHPAQSSSSVATVNPFCGAGEYPTEALSNIKEDPPSRVHEPDSIVRRPPKCYLWG